MTVSAEEIKSFEHFFEITNPLKNSYSFIYRGQKKIFDNKGLIPRVGRYLNKIREIYSIEGNIIKYQDMSEESFLDHEKDLYQTFDLRTRHLLEFQNVNPFMKLALAQHHGLATRLLDWTLNPLVALFFAIEESSDDGKYYDFPVIYRLRHSEFNKDLEKSPTEVKDIRFIAPYGITKRIVAQQGVFTVHPNPWKPFDSNDLEVFKISPVVRSDFKKILFVYGFNRETLFPDLDGAASAYNYWKFEIATER